MEALVSPAIVQEYAAALDTSADRDRFLQVVEQLTLVSLSGHPADATSAASEHRLGRFLAFYCESVATLFAANTVAIWFARLEGGPVQRRVDVGWHHLALDPEVSVAHDALIHLAFRGPEVMSVRPFASPDPESKACNPTDSFLLLVPAAHGNRVVAVLEIALGPKPLRRPHDALVRAYWPWLTWLQQLLEHGMQRCYVADQPLFSALNTLHEAANEVETIQAQIVVTIQDSLRSLAGRRFGSLAANQRVAKEVHALLDSKGLRVKCPECGAAAILRCQNAGNARTGAFVYDHYLERGRTFHGGPSTFPLLELIPKPPRRKS